MRANIYIYIYIYIYTYICVHILICSCIICIIFFVVSCLISSKPVGIDGSDRHGGLVSKKFEPIAFDDFLYQDVFARIPTPLA